MSRSGLLHAACAQLLALGLFIVTNTSSVTMISQEDMVRHGQVFLRDAPGSEATHLLRIEGKDMDKNYELIQDVCTQKECFEQILQLHPVEWPVLIKCYCSSEEKASNTSECEKCTPGVTLSVSKPVYKVFKRWGNFKCAEKLYYIVCDSICFGFSFFFSY